MEGCNGGEEGDMNGDGGCDDYGCCYASGDCHGGGDDGSSDTNSLGDRCLCKVKF